VIKVKADTAIKLEKAQEEALEKMVEAGLFSNKEEAARAAIIKYASDIGVLSPETLWNKIVRYKKRKVTPGQLKKDLEMIENKT
jgi:Arc/MetJ-type ribon-helix-helix transcriptional regulator